LAAEAKESRISFAGKSKDVSEQRAHAEYNVTQGFVIPQTGIRFSKTDKVGNMIDLDKDNRREVEAYT
jgi:hypothetical protein